MSKPSPVVTSPHNSRLSMRAWYPSTWFALAVAFGGLLLMNLPGQMVLEPEFNDWGKYGPEFDVYSHCEHGWPLVYLRRQSVNIPTPPYYRMSPWRLNEGFESFSLPPLLVNVGCCSLLALAAAVVFQAWRRGRMRLLQFHIRELLLLALLISAAAGYMGMQRTQHAAELRTLADIDQIKDFRISFGDSVANRVEWQMGGPSWAREFFGDRHFEHFDRVVKIRTSGSALKEAVRLRHLRVVSLGIATVSDRELKYLEELPQLEALDLCMTNFHFEGRPTVTQEGYIIDHYLELPRLPRLRGLNLRDTVFRGEGLENIPAIEVLDLCETEVDNDAVRKLLGLSRLQVLDLSLTKIDDGAVPVLSKLTGLKTLHLNNSAITEAGYQQLKRALPGCEIQWWNSEQEF